MQKGANAPFSFPYQDIFHLYLKLVFFIIFCYFINFIKLPLEFFS